MAYERILINQSFYGLILAEAHKQRQAEYKKQEAAAGSSVLWNTVVSQLITLLARYEY